MAVTVTLEAAATELSALVERAAAGEEVLITRSGEAVARLVAVEAPRDGGAGTAGDGGIDPLEADIRRVFASRYRV